MPRYRFSETVVYKSGNPWPTYQAGEVYDLPRDHGERWVRRHVAAEVEGDSAVLLEPVAVPEVPEVVAAVERGAMTVNEARNEMGMPDVAPASHTPRLLRNRRP